jgi:hypothetical protein
MENLIGQPVEVMPAGDDSGRLLVTKFTQENPEKTNTDHLIARDNRYFLCVQEPIRFKNLLKNVGKVCPARIYEKSGDEKYEETEIDILRNHPVQYAGLVFQTESGSEYGITPDYRFMALTKRSSVNGARIKTIAGLEDTAAMHMLAGGYLGSLGKNKTQNFLFQEGKAIRPGRFLLLSITDEESRIRERNGCKTSKIEKIRYATAEELARYSA